MNINTQLTNETNLGRTTPSVIPETQKETVNTNEFTAPSKTASLVTTPNSAIANELFLDKSFSLLQRLSNIVNKLTNNAEATQGNTALTAPEAGNNASQKATTTTHASPENYADSLIGLQSADMTSSGVSISDLSNAELSDPAILSQFDLSDSSTLSQVTLLLNSNTTAATTLRSTLTSIADLEPFTSEARDLERDRRAASRASASADGRPAPVFDQTVEQDIPRALVLNQNGNNPISSNRLQAALLLASSEDNFHLVIDGQVNINDRVRVFPREDLSVDAQNASFIGRNGLDGDMISIDAAPGSNPVSGEDINVTWRGGFFDISGLDTAAADSPLVEQFIPEGNNLVSEARRSQIAARRGTQATSDALSIRGVNEQDNQRISSAQVSDIRVTGLPVEVGANGSPGDTVITTDFENLEPSENLRQGWPDAGGDSGLFVQGVSDLDIRDSEFYGIRDAGIYVTASGIDSAQESAGAINYGENFLITGNKINNAFDGISSKRGADNVTINFNDIEDVSTAISTKKTLRDPDTDASRAEFVRVSDNNIRGASRGILLEATNFASVIDNNITEIGRPTGNLPFATNTTERGAFEGIVFEGVGPTAIDASRSSSFEGRHEIRGNTIAVTEDNSVLEDLANMSGVISRFIAISQRDFNQGAATSAIEQAGISLAPGSNSIQGFNTGREAGINGNDIVRSTGDRRVNFTQQDDITTG